MRLRSLLAQNSVKRISEIPVLADQSWGELYSDLLSSALNFNNSGLSTDLDSGEPSSVPFSGVELGIEAWAAQTLSLSPEDFSSHTISSQIHSPQPPLDAFAIVCYGMVSRAS